MRAKLGAGFYSAWRSFILRFGRNGKWDKSAILGTMALLPQIEFCAKSIILPSMILLSYRKDSHATSFRTSFRSRRSSMMRALEVIGLSGPHLYRGRGKEKRSLFYLSSIKG